MTGQEPGVVKHFPGTRTGKRWGLVLGGGGVLGAAWLIGALDALEKARNLDAREADVIVGTSAGSIIGALLAGGTTVAEQRERQLADNVPRTAQKPKQKQKPQRPKLRPGSPGLVRTRNVPPLVRLAGLAPTGRARLDDVAALIENQVGTWPEGFRAVVLDYDTGRRVQLGDGDVAEAVRASCSIPGWFEPVTIDGRRYVDGGTWSISNADLLVGEDLDEVFVLAPMAATAYDTPTDWRVKLERRIRARNTRRTLAEARQINQAGTAVTVISPGPEELTQWGYNFMRPGRRKIILTSAAHSVEHAFKNTTIDLREKERGTTESA